MASSPLAGACRFIMICSTISGVVWLGPGPHDVVSTPQCGGSLATFIPNILWILLLFTVYLTFFCSPSEFRLAPEHIIVKFVVTCRFVAECNFCRGREWRGTISNLLAEWTIVKPSHGATTELYYWLSRPLKHSYWDSSNSFRTFNRLFEWQTKDTY